MSAISDHDRQRLLVDWNATEGLDRRDACLHELFEEQARARPSAVAIEGEGGQGADDALGPRAGAARGRPRSRIPFVLEALAATCGSAFASTERPTRSSPFSPS